MLHVLQSRMVITAVQVLRLESCPYTDTILPKISVSAAAVETEACITDTKVTVMAISSKTSSDNHATARRLRRDILAEKRHRMLGCIHVEATIKHERSHLLNS